jgi:hypothetical protein
MRASRDPAAILERKPRFVHEKSRAEARRGGDAARMSATLATEGMRVQNFLLTRNASRRKTNRELGGNGNFPPRLRIIQGRSFKLKSIRECAQTQAPITGSRESSPASPAKK